MIGSSMPLLLRNVPKYNEHTSHHSTPSSSSPTSLPQKLNPSSSPAAEHLRRLPRDLEAIARTQITLHGIQIAVVELHVARVVLDIHHLAAQVHRHEAVGR